MNVHAGANIEYGWTRDRSIQSVASGIELTQASVTIVPFRRTYLSSGTRNLVQTNTQFGQDFRGTFKFTPRVNNANTADRTAGNQKSVVRTNIPAGHEWYRTWDQNIGTLLTHDTNDYWPTAPDPISLQPGTYTMDFEPAAPSWAQALERRDLTMDTPLATFRAMTWDTQCSSHIPTFEFTVEANKFYSLFVLGQYGCRKRAFMNTWAAYAPTAANVLPPVGSITGIATDRSRLVPVLVESLPFGSATASPSTQQQSFFNAASPVSSSVSMLVLAALSAVLMAFL
jgi:hypothetical protein